MKTIDSPTLLSTPSHVRQQIWTHLGVRDLARAASTCKELGDCVDTYAAATIGQVRHLDKLHGICREIDAKWRRDEIMWDDDGFSRCAISPSDISRGLLRTYRDVSAVAERALCKDQPNLGRLLREGLSVDACLYGAKGPTLMVLASRRDLSRAVPLLRAHGASEESYKKAWAWAF